MKNYLICLIAILAIAVPKNSMAQSDKNEAYAVLSDNNTVLTYYYDGNKALRKGLSLEDRDNWRVYYEDIISVRFDSSFAKYNTLTSTASWFWGFKNLTTIIDLCYLNTENVTNMWGMFYGCSSLTSLDLSNFNTSKVTNMASMFSGCSNLTILDLSNFNTENVSDMSSMFYCCYKLTNIELGSFKTENVTNMRSMFGGCRNLTSLDLCNFNTFRVVDMSGLFYECKNIETLVLTKYDYNTYKFTDNFKTDNVKDMSFMFCYCSNLKKIIGSFNTSNVTNMSDMFSCCSNLTELGIIKDFDTSNVTNMHNMFIYCSQLQSLDLSEFKTEKVIDMQNMFRYCTNLSTIYVGSRWSIKSVINGNDMFSGCTKLSGEKETKYDETKTDYTYARFDGGTSSPGYFTRGTHNVFINIIGNGYVVYNQMYRNSLIGFSVTDGTSVSIELVPDKGSVLKSFTVDGNDEISNIADNIFTMSIISCPIIEVIFDTIQAISKDGIEYRVVSANDETVTVTRSNHGLYLNIPNSFTAYGIEWTVIGIEKDALKDASELAAVIWNPEYIFTENVSNPNLLLYVKSEDYAPAEINNVIVNGTAKKITLTDAVSGSNFYCPQAFSANQITYEHNYNMKTGFNTCRGWESIALPFDVTNVNSSTGAELIPYSLWTYGDIQRPFWLYGLNKNGWKSENAIKANTPYLISMPNNENYDASYNQSGKIVFSASNVEVKASDEITNSKYGQRIFVPNYQHQKSSSDIFALNVNNSIYTYTESDPVEGSAFIRELRDVGPFEAYMMIEGNASATRSLSIFGDDDTTGITDIPTSNGYNNGEVRVYLPSGVLLKSGKDDSILQDLPHGIYIVNGKKIIK